jgi:hypothetical protein
MILSFANVLVGLISGAVDLLARLLGKLQSDTRIGRFDRGSREDAAEGVTILEGDSNFHTLQHKSRLAGCDRHELEDSLYGEVCKQEQKSVCSMLS